MNITELEINQVQRKILRTLCLNQKEFYGLDSNQRWGFAVAQNSSGFPRFSAAAEGLAEEKLIRPDYRNLWFLTDEGLAFCKKNPSILNDTNDVWTEFFTIMNPNSL